MEGLRRRLASPAVRKQPLWFQQAALTSGFAPGHTVSPPWFFSSSSLFPSQISDLACNFFPQNRGSPAYKCSPCALLPPSLAQHQASQNQFSRILSAGSRPGRKRLGRRGSSVEGLSTSAEIHLTLSLRQEHFLPLKPSPGHTLLGGGLLGPRPSFRSQTCSC